MFHSVSVAESETAIVNVLLYLLCIEKFICDNKNVVYFFVLYDFLFFSFSGIYG